MKVKEIDMEYEIVCENGHKTTPVFWVDGGNVSVQWGDYNPQELQYIPVSRQDYRYTHGSCCFRAACEAVYTKLARKLFSVA